LPGQAKPREEWFRKHERELLEQAQKERVKRYEVYKKEYEKAEHEKTAPGSLA